jgi:hypothetical protein
MVIRGLAITGAGTAVNVIEQSSGFVAENDWLGVKLNGTAGANTRGIFLDPESDGAIIGGLTPEARNVIANSTNEGLDIQGASLAKVLGNYIGVGPDGATAAPNGKNVEVTSSAAQKAVGNEIGGELSPQAAGTQSCDGACNVISGSPSSGIDLLGEGGGEEPPPQSTLIHANYIGLNAGGGGPVPNAMQGILVGKSHETKIGAGTPETVNRITGGNYGILAGSGGVAADHLAVEGNSIGTNVANGVMSPPSSGGIVVDSAGVPGLEAAANISENLIRMTGAEAIQQHGPGAAIEENIILGSRHGIRTYGAVGPEGNTIEGNLIQNAIETGVLVENDGNVVIGNEIGNGATGIHLGPLVLEGVTASGNTIGGDTAEEENTLTGNSGDAIEIAGDGSDQNVVARNGGDENDGLFIDLAADGQGNPALGPNGGIQAPVISAATPTALSGTAEAGATVRVFGKATSAPGEIEGFLGQTTADGSGNWSFAYGAPLPEGTPVAATQTAAAKGTSELAIATTAKPPSEDGGGGGGGGAAEADTSPPQTKITKGPRKKTRKRTARFRFSSSEAGSSFECKLDRGPFRPCRSPRKYKKLKPGRHVFRVRAVDASGNRDHSPAVRKFRVLP